MKEFVRLDNFYTSKYDRVFKAIFVNKEDPELLECILKETLDSVIKIKEFHITELSVRQISERVKVLDVLIELENGDYILCEVNTRYDSITKERNLAFLETYASQTVKRGTSYQRNSKVILINYNFTNKISGPIIDTFQYKNGSGELYTDKRLIVEVNVDKIVNNYYNEVGKEKYKYLAMLDMNQEDLYKLSKSDAIASKYYNKLMDLNTDKHFVQLLSNDEENKIYVNSEIAQAKEDGLKEGLEKGLEKGLEQGLEQGLKQGQSLGYQKSQLDIARNMLDKGLDINFVSEVTKLPIKELESISKEN